MVNGNFNFLLSAEGRGEHLNTFLSTEDHGEGQGQLQVRQLQKVDGNFNFLLSAENTLSGAGFLGALGYWWALVRRGRGPTCQCTAVGRKAL